MQNKKQTLVQSTITLFISMVVVKIFGVLFKIPLANILGETGSGYFNTAYSIFTPVYTLSVAGLPSAVSKLIAEKCAFSKHADIKRILKISRWFFICLGTVGSGALFAFARPICVMLKNPNAYYSVLAISPAIFFGCVIASYRGYFEGLQNMVPTAISQIIEVVIKLIFGLSGAYFVLNYTLEQYNLRGSILGIAISDASDAKIISLSLASAACIVGVTISMGVSTVFLAIRYKHSGYGTFQISNLDSAPPIRYRILVKKLIRTALPIAAASIVLNVTSLVDVATIMRRLSVAVQNGKDIIFAQYGRYLPQSISEGEIPNFIYGAYSGFAVSIFTMVPYFTGVFGKSSLPAIANAWSSGNHNLVQDRTLSVIRMTCFIAFPAGIGIFAMAKPILTMLFPNQPGAVFIASDVLSLMGIGVIFLSLVTPIFSILQAIGKADVPIKLMPIGIVVKFICNYIFVAIPCINIKGASIGTILCYGFIVIASVIILAKKVKLKISFYPIFIKPLLCSLSSVTGGYLLYTQLLKIMSNFGSVAISIIFTTVFYAILLLVSKTFTKNDVLMLSKSEKLRKTLDLFVKR